MTTQQKSQAEIPGMDPVALARLYADIAEKSGELLARTMARGGDELQLETDAECLARPTAAVQLRRLPAFGPDLTA